MSRTDDKEDYTYLDDVNKNNFERIKQKAMKIGYAEGISDGRESVFQNGFDQGYADGLAASFDLEKFRFFFKHLNTDKIKNKDLVKENEEYKTLSIVDLKSFLFIEDSINTISKERVEDIIMNFANKIPLTTSLLNVQ